MPIDYSSAFSPLRRRRLPDDGTPDDMTAPNLPVAAGAFSPSIQSAAPQGPSLEGTDVYGGYQQNLSDLRQAIQPQHVNTGRAILGGLLGPRLGSVITGDYQRQRALQPLLQQHALFQEQIANQRAQDLQRAQIGNYQSEAQRRADQTRIEQGQLGVKQEPPPKTAEERTYDWLVNEKNMPPDQALEVVKNSKNANPAAKNTEEQIKQSLAQEMSKPQPNPKVVKGYQDQLRNLNPLGEDRIRDAESRAADANARAAEAGARAQQSLGLREQARQDFHPAVAQQVVQGMATQASTRRLLKLMEPYKDNNEPFSNFLKTIEYKMGKAQADQIGEELASLNLTSLQQGGAVLKGMGGTRSATVLHEVMQHTPDPLKDSNKLMYQKMKNMDRATATFLEEADKYGRKKPGEIPTESMTPYGQAPAGGGSEDDPLGILPKKKGP